MNEKQFIQKIMTDVKVKVAELCDDNFSNKGFFGQKWADSKHPRNWGSTMYRTGNLARSLTYTVQSNTLTISSSLPYASLQNEGGTITVTAKMKAFFWAMYAKATGGITTKKDGSKSNSKRNQALSAEAQAYKAMALLKVGHKINIKQRQYVGPHPVIDAAVEKIVDKRVAELGTHINDVLSKAFTKK